mmetsp:Transcript_34672/g.87742  ORF Transcript_34672/g.87742 Transcript_34672/m.87742 type:complete len:1232 (-) Transcript_34672:139-3834(-)|eukprot:CAMPEP_0202862638 /NCGR_PEP_ID=MMETSP1391-20130828/3610_1 /ASSEMBLY_ACC=CAM_ASM_000867 /TAXON_ID=1034604 /ORGANISM="Chlamydomonas leiostraca, Strain SAG 11-49" /LENGTH=1231 /DNA_ID=CAMNT_0049542205 /DNA_START=47 /DNA_END=3742 /DNA_ORIENTATION=+
MQASIQSRGPTAHAVALKPSGSEAKRNAEALFESRTVAEIREIENRTRKDIDVKKQQLRQLVGDSYRDLIDSADKIVSIATNCGHILNNVKSIQGGFTSLAHSFTTADSLLNEKRDSLTKHEELYAIGGRIRYLVDTPEMIWGCLDSKQHLGAARRYLRAEHVHSLLKTSFSSDILAKFPLLSHQWPLVEKFKKQISDAVSASLSSEAALSTEQAADALAAACALDGHDSQAALALLLSSRRSWIKSQLTSYQDPSACSTEEVGAVLANLAQSVQLTIQQVGELFLAGSKAGGVPVPAVDAGACALQLSAREDDLDVSELLFGGRNTSGGATSGGAQHGGPEVEAWRRATKAMHDRLVALSSGVVERACMQWVREVAEDFTRHGPVLLRTCATAQELVAVEEAVAAAIAAGPHSSKQQRAGSGGAAPSAATMLAKRQHSAPSGLSALGLGPAGSGSVAQAHSPSWDTVCEWVLGAPLLLWQEVFHAPFVARAKELVAASFSAVAAAVEDPLSACLADAAAAPPEPAGQVASTRWPMAPISTNVDPVLGSAAAGMQRTWSEKIGTVVRTAGKPSQGADRSFRLRVHGIRQRFDDELQAVLKSVLLLLGPEGGHHHYSASVPGGLGDLSTPYGSTSGGGAAPGAGGRKREGSRAVELEPFVQQQCVELAASLAAMLRARLEKVGAPVAGLAGAPAAEQVLIIGRLCSALAGESKYLPVLLGPPEAWRQAANSGPGAVGRAAGMRPGAGGRAAAPSSRLQGVVDGFKATGITAYKQWASWAAVCLVGPLRAALLADDTLVSNTTPVSWQVTVIASAGGVDPADMLASGLGGDGGGEMRFHLPACPTPAALSLLNAACAEIRRAGDHTAAVEALQVFEWELAGAAMDCYTHLIGPKASFGAASTTSYGRGNSLDLAGATSGYGASAGAAASLAGRLSEKGVLQLLVDVRYLRDVLAGGRPLNPRSTPPGASAGGGAPLPLVDPQDPTALAAMAERKRQGTGLEQQLQDRLDPIDWATYEPYLWANVKRYYQRTAALFGLMVQLQRVHAEAAAGAAGRVPGATGGGTAGGVVDLNPLNVLPVAPRFQYLPISTPTAAGLAASKARPSTPSFARLQSGGASTSDLAAAYSFADVGTGLRGAGAGGVDSSGASAAASGASGALGALQARLQATGALGSLSSMLGDKAAEMTAMAQQRFDSISDLGSGLGGFLGGAGTGLGTNLLSQLTKGVGGGGAKK